MNDAEKVRQFVIDNFMFGEGASLRDDQSFLESGIVDSTGMLELIMFLECAFGIKIQSEEMVPENLDSVNRVVRFVTEKVTKTIA